MDIYYIGGSPCVGKSTVTEMLVEKYDLYYFRVDDLLDKYTQMGVAKGYEICKKQAEMDWDQIWMRDPVLQCKEELKFYEEIFEFAIKDLKQITGEKRIITEGAAWLPRLMKRIGVSSDRYISITPTPEFQVSHYKKRVFVPYILKDCKDKEAAFKNWMDRDILFAKAVQHQCEEEKYLSYINCGEMTVDEMVEMVEKHFELVRK